MTRPRASVTPTSTAGRGGRGVGTSLARPPAHSIDPCEPGVPTKRCVVCGLRLDHQLVIRDVHEHPLCTSLEPAEYDARAYGPVLTLIQGGVR